MFGQKVTLTPTVVNGSNVNSGTINLGGSISSTISLNVKVETPTNSPDNGTISIYYEKSPALGANIARGGNGVFLNFGGGKIGIINFVIYLDSADFNTSGGNIYAEYKNYAGATYKSSNIAIIKDGTSPPPPPLPYKYIEIVPYGGTPILPLFHEYSYVASQEWVNNGDQIIQLGSPFYQGVDLREKTTFNDGSITYSEKINYNIVNFLPQFDNLYVNNKITGNQYLTAGQVPEMIVGNEPTESHTIKGEGRRSDQSVTNSLKNYNIQWQSRIKYPSTWYNMGTVFFSMYGWTDISGATQMNYLPPQTNTGMEYRRLIVEDPNDKSSYRRCAASNVISVVSIQDSSENTICCDQSLQVSGIANSLIGSIPNKDVFYQWQISNDEINWEEIPGATKKDFLPIYILTPRSTIETKTQYYRRTFNVYSNNQYYISNISKVIYLANNGSMVKIYPNPTTSLLNLESARVDLTNSKVHIVNFAGSTIIPNNIQVISSNLITIDVSNLIAGPYFLNIESEIRNYKYTFIKQ